MTDQIISRVVGNLGHITLNRPKALNALTYDMCAALTELLVKWERDPNIGAVLVDGAGDRAFCAGGDVVVLHDSGKAGDSRAEDFWRIEYPLNELIHRYSKPYIALIDGIVMGGGVGLSVHGHHRIAGDTTLFAMPETGIGYFADVGGTYFLPRLDYHNSGQDLGMALGHWLGLSGARLDMAQCCMVGIATAYVPTEDHAALTQALAEASLSGTDDDVLAVLERFVKKPPMADPFPAALSAFTAGSVADIFKALDDMPDDAWAQKQAASIRKKSPLACCVTFEALERGAKMSFRDAMQQELELSMNFLVTQDFYEGIRAQLIDKDRNPGWSHGDVNDVTEAQTLRLFKPISQPPLEFLS